jgi:hypothetical protein
MNELIFSYFFRRIASHTVLQRKNNRERLPGEKYPSDRVHG